MINPMDLTGKTILVTGASSGIGKATAVQLSRLGAKLVLAARNEERLEQVLATLEGAGHACYSVDLAKIGEIEAFVKKAVTEHGPFHGLVHSAGIGKTRPVAMLKYENAHEVMAINFFAFLELVRCITKKGGFDTGGSIVGVSSIASVRGSKSKTAYNASKAAMDSAIRCMALELAVKQIRVNSVMPGWVKTEMLSGYIARKDDAQSALNAINEKQPLGIIEPAEAANLIAFLLSDAAKKITGTAVIIDGGQLQS